MRNKNLLGLIILIIMIVSCDPIYWTSIINDSNHDISVEMQYDSSSLKRYWGTRSYIPFLDGAVKDGGSLISFDTVNLIATIKLEPNETFNVEGGIGVSPDFEIIKKITIFSVDTILLDNRDKMHEAFIKLDKTRHYKLSIKK